MAGGVAQRALAGALVPAISLGPSVASHSLFWASFSYSGHLTDVIQSLYGLVTLELYGILRRWQRCCERLIVSKVSLRYLRS